MKFKPWYFALILLIFTSVACMATPITTVQPLNITSPAPIKTTLAPTKTALPASSTPTVVSSLTPTIIPSPTATVDETLALIKAVKAALVVEHGPGAASLDVTVSKIDGNYAEGAASAQGGGAMWFAAKVNGVWKLVWDGNGQIDCSSLIAYPSFPTDMIPECWNSATNTLVTR